MELQLHFRLATVHDLPQIVQMLADDHLGKTTEVYTDPLPENYYLAFRDIQQDNRQELMVAELDGAIVGTFQLSYLPYLINQGGCRALVEAVRVHSNYRGKGIGHLMFAFIFERARQKGCSMVQLTSNKKRVDAIRFYKSIGFADSHEGMKLEL